MSVEQFPRSTGQPNFRILSLDGGGVRGVMTLEILCQMERALGKPLWEYFDVIAGTSVGAVIACGIASGRTIEDARDKFQDEIYNTFHPKHVTITHKFLDAIRGKGKYCEKALAQTLKRTYGDSLFGDCKTKAMVIAYDLVKKAVVAFRSDNEKHKYLETWEIVLSSSSAPVIFDEHQIRYTDNGVGHLADGGLVANNPVLIALSDYNTNIYNTTVVSIGTGAVRDNKKKVRTAIDNSTTLVDATFYGSTNTADRIAQNLLPRDNYFRFQPPIDWDVVKLDGVENVSKLVQCSRSYMKRSGRELLDRLVNRTDEAPIMHYEERRA